jgi:hypothetical protein
MSRTGARGIAALVSICTLALLGSGGCLAEEDDPSLEDIEGGGRHRRNPVVFVHGCPPPIGTNEGDSRFALPMIDFFRESGYPDSFLRRFVSPTAQCDSSITQAFQLRDFVDDVLDETGARKVDIVAHSIGAITSRIFIRLATERVDHFVSVAGANHGSQTAAVAREWQAAFGAPAFEGAKEMFPPYACLGQTEDAIDVQFVLNGCLTPTGRTSFRDETPGDVEVLSFRNTLDEIVVPVESSCLNQRFQNDCSDRVNKVVTVPPAIGPCGPGGEPGPCPAHVAMMFDPDLIERTFDLITDDRHR